MSTSEQIRTAWLTGVLNHASIEAITSRVWTWDAAAEIDSDKERTLLMHNQEMNFFTLLVSRAQLELEARGAGQPSKLQFRVLLSYYREKSPGQADRNFNAVSDALEVADTLVRSELGPRWSNTVDWYEFAGQVETTLTTIKERQVWRGAFEYRAFKQI